MRISKLWHPTLASLALAACAAEEPPPAVPLDEDMKRSVPLHGAPNFRDLGGYETADGRTVRWGMLYRSDELAELDDADVAELERRGLRLVVDLRSSEEIAEAPNRIPATVTQHLHAQLGNQDANPESIKHELLSGELDARDVHVMKLENYREHVLGENRSSIASLLREIARDGGVPMVFHCAGGRDRTGVAAAVLLELLGVSRNQIYADYMLTNRHLQIEDRRARMAAMDLPDATVEAVMRATLASPEYLAMAFGAIDENYGSVEAYVRHGLGVEDEVVAELRARLLDR